MFILCLFDFESSSEMWNRYLLKATFAEENNFQEHEKNGPGTHGNSKKLCGSTLKIF